MTIADSAWLGFYLSQAKLQATSRISALLSGFIMVSMVEVHLAADIPTSLLIIFSISTALVVAVNLIALFISTCILPHIEAVASIRSNSAVSEFDQRDNVNAHSPHIRLHRYIEVSWILSTGIGILLFLTQMAVVGWVRLDDLSRPAAIVSTAIIVPAIILFLLFSIKFYRSVVSYKYRSATSELRQLEDEVNNLQSKGLTASSDV